MSYPTGQYLEIKEGRRRLRPTRPRVFHDDEHMTPVDDAWLIANQGLYPVHEPDAAAEVVYKPETDWTVLADKVLKTYWLVVEKTYNPFYQRLQSKPEPDWTYTETHCDKNVVVDVPLEEVKAQAIETLAEERYRHETGGLLHEGNKIHTDRDSQAKMTSNFVAIMSNLITTDIEWKTVDGFVTFTPADYQTMAATALGFVQACYDREKEVGALIAGATTYAELAAAHAEIYAGFPANALYVKE